MSCCTATSGFNIGDTHGQVERQSTLRTKARREKRGGRFLPGLDTFGFSRTALSRDGERISRLAVHTVLGRRRVHPRHDMPHNHDVRSSQNSLYTIYCLDSRRSSRYYIEDPSREVVEQRTRWYDE